MISCLLSYDLTCISKPIWHIILYWLLCGVYFGDIVLSFESVLRTSTMSDCSVCKRPSSVTRNSIKCSECSNICHGNCVNMTKEDIECLASLKKTWCCPPCLNARRKSLSDESSEIKDKGDISQVITMLQEAKADRKRMEHEMSKSFEFVHDTFKEQKEALQKQDEKLSSYLQAMELLSQENINLKRKVADLEARLDECEQYTRSNSVEIFGLPQDKLEDVYELVGKVCGALDVPVTRTDIDACHRLGKRQGSDQPAGIIVKFVRRETKLKLLEKRRVKRNFSTKDLGYTAPADPVYINESLSPVKRKILAAARAVKKEKQFTYLWVRNGKIFLRKNPGDPVIVVNSMEAITKLQ